MKETILIPSNRTDVSRALLVEACRLAKVLNLQMWATRDSTMQRPAYTTFQPKVGAA